jgi:hypothetical protein
MFKQGQIVEHYQGTFAKIVKVSSEGGRFHLSAWVKSPAAAEVETVAVMSLNSFGMSQVVKSAEKPAKAEKEEKEKKEKPAKAE